MTAGKVSPTRDKMNTEGSPDNPTIRLYTNLRLSHHNKMEKIDLLPDGTSTIRRKRDALPVVPAPFSKV